jgi:hypothetical protein
MTITERVKKELTRDEFIEEYGDVVVKFSDYYKYTFHYATLLPDGSRIVVGVGGNADDIYRNNVSAGREVTIRDLDPYKGDVISTNNNMWFTYVTMYDY